MAEENDFKTGELEDLQTTLEALKIQSQQMSSGFKDLHHQVLQYLVVFTKGGVGKFLEYLEILFDFLWSTLVTVGIVFASNVASRFLESQNLTDASKLLLTILGFAEITAVVIYVLYLITVTLAGFGRLIIIKVMLIKAEIRRAIKDASKDT